MSEEKKLEIWLRMYEAQNIHARHHEVLRTQSTNLIVLISAALIALYGSEVKKLESSIIGVFIVVINLYGLFMSLKHYERSRLHVSVGAEYRGVLSKNSTLGTVDLNDVRSAAHKAHKPMFGLQKIRAYFLWSGLHVVLLLLGSVIVASG